MLNVALNPTIGGLVLVITVASHPSQESPSQSTDFFIFRDLPFGLVGVCIAYGFTH